MKMRRRVILHGRPRRLSVIICLAAFIAVTGCGFSGSRGRLKFDELRYPASMSPYLYGRNNEFLAKDRELRVINKFSVVHDYWGTFYSLIPLTAPKDTGEQINRAIEEAGGDGIVNVKVTAETDFSVSVPLLSFLPVWPSKTKVVVEGDIVKYEPSTNYGQLRAEEVLVITKTDDKVTNRLNTRCRVVGRGDRFFAGFTSSSCPTAYYGWNITIPAETEGRFPHMFNYVKMRAQEKGANAVQIVYLSYDREEIERKHRETPSAPSVSDYSRSVAMEVQYWLCPAQDVHGASLR